MGLPARYGGHDDALRLFETCIVVVVVNTGWPRYSMGSEVNPEIVPKLPSKY